MGHFRGLFASLTADIWHQVSTVPRAVILNGWNDIVIRYYKAIFEAYRGVLKLFPFFLFINNSKLSFD